MKKIGKQWANFQWAMECLKFMLIQHVNHQFATGCINFCFIDRTNQNRFSLFSFPALTSYFRCFFSFHNIGHFMSSIRILTNQDENNNNKPICYWMLALIDFDIGWINKLIWPFPVTSSSNHICHIEQIAQWKQTCLCCQNHFNNTYLLTYDPHAYRFDGLFIFSPHWYSIKSTIVNHFRLNIFVYYFELEFVEMIIIKETFHLFYMIDIMFALCCLSIAMFLLNMAQFLSLLLLLFLFTITDATCFI